MRNTNRIREAIAKSPEDLSLYSPAAEAFLGRKNGPLALEFAVQGQKLAQKQNHRDAEHQFQELIEAARKVAS